jgi:hypothetical protein
MRLPFRRPQEASDIANMFASGVRQTTPAGHDYESGQVANLSPVVRHILQHFMVPWLLKVLTKYSEPEFHAQMSGTYINAQGQPAKGKDFIADFYQNHRRSFSAFIKLTRKYRNILQVDVNDQLNKLVYVMNQKGWTVYPHEKMCIQDTLYKIMAMIRQ